MKSTRTLSVRVPEETAQLLDRVAGSTGISISILTRQAIEDYCEKLKKSSKIEVHIPAISIGSIAANQKGGHIGSINTGMAITSPSPSKKSKR